MDVRSKSGHLWEARARPFSCISAGDYWRVHRSPRQLYPFEDLQLRAQLSPLKKEGSSSQLTIAV